MVRKNIEKSYVVLSATTINNPNGLLIKHSDFCPAMLYPKEVNEQKIQLAVAVVIINEKKVLLTKRTPLMKSFPNTWVIPGGHVEYGESLEDSAQREVLEEVGLEIDNIRFLGLWESVYPPISNHKQPKRQHLVCYFLANSTSNQLDPNLNEINQYVWLTHSQIQHLIQNNVSEKETIVKGFQCHDISLKSLQGDLKMKTGTTQGTKFALSQYLKSLGKN